MRLAAALLIAFAAPAVAQAPATVTSPGPAAVAVTVYRAPGGGELTLDDLNGYALVTETRTVRLPAGPATIRFAGVAGGILPVSAIVTGLPGGVVEKNRDARLLSPAALIDGTLGRRVTLTRTDKASGAVRVQQATVIAGPAGGVVVRTPDGVEALGCSGLAEHPAYAGVPVDVTAGPVLSVATVSPAATTATVRLSYLTSAFDWRASYVATLSPDGRHLDLLAWLTLANGNAERFTGAELLAVAGRVNHNDERQHDEVAPLRLDCYPLGTTTSTLRARQFERAPTGPLLLDAVPPPPPVPAPMMAEDVVVTGAKVEQLGDLKLYRVPMRVTVAANAQKQVVLFAKDSVPYERVYRLTVQPAEDMAQRPTAVVLRLRNLTTAGLGVPLPAGGTTLYALRGGERVLLGVGALKDKAVGEIARIAAGQSDQVRIEQSSPADDSGTLVATNANPFAATIEIALDTPPGNVVGNPAIREVEGRPTWVATVPAHGTAGVTYRLKPDHD